MLICPKCYEALETLTEKVIINKMSTQDLKLELKSRNEYSIIKLKEGIAEISSRIDRLQDEKIDLELRIQNLKRENSTYE